MSAVDYGTVGRTGSGKVSDLGSIIIEAAPAKYYSELSDIVATPMHIHGGWCILR